MIPKSTQKQSPPNAPQTAASTPGPKRWIIAVDVAVAILAVSLIGWGMHRQLNSKTTEGPCKVAGKTHELVLQNDQLFDDALTVKQCDTVSILNKDDLAYSMNFGVHDKHISYPGYTAQTFGPNESLHIDMIEPGTFELHDHYRDNAKITLTVTPL